MNGVHSNHPCREIVDEAPHLKAPSEATHPCHFSRCNQRETVMMMEGGGDGGGAGSGVIGSEVD